MKIVFLGSSELSIIPLKRLIQAGYEISGIICQPDKPNKRGKKIEFSALKRYAISKNIPVYQFNKIREEGAEILRKLNPDLLVVVYYGQILSQEIIDIGKYGIINLHPSLLPKYRGASPVITSILNGDDETGVSIMRIEKSVDSGNILKQQKVKIEKGESAGKLWDRLTNIGSELMIEVIELIKNNAVNEVEQDHSQATFTRMFSKKDAEIDFNKDVEQVVNHIRAFNPSPIAFFKYKGENFRVYEAESLQEAIKAENLQEIIENVENSTIIAASLNEGLQIKAKNGVVSIKTIQAPNGKVLNIKNFLNGRKFEIGYVIK